MAASDAYQHRLEIRAAKLAKVITRHVETLHSALQPPGARPPFTTLKSDAGAREWWMQNIDSTAGQAVLAKMTPMQQLELHNALSQHIKTLMPSPPPNGG